MRHSRDFVQELRDGFPGRLLRLRGGIFAATIWLGFILFPLVNAIAGGGSAVGEALTIAAAGVFVVAYVALMFSWRRRSRRYRQIGLGALMLTMAIALTLASGQGWAFLFTYCAAVMALLFSRDLAWLSVMVCAALAAVCSAIAGASGGNVISYTVTALGIGLLMVLMRDLRDRNDELTEARAELAQAAVVQERERFARDLHDLLGHTLSVITLKAELAGRLLPDQPERAAAEVGEVEQVARQALSEVREAVSGYRQPTLEGEIAGARMALSAAGIEASIRDTEATLAPEVEAVLAWAVREGATNVIRHSGAEHCTVRVTAGLSEVEAEVLDDGSGRSAVFGNAPAGHGLAGLRERAEALGGQLEAGPLRDGGFRVAVSVPVRGSGSGAAPAAGASDSASRPGATPAPPTGAATPAPPTGAASAVPPTGAATSAPPAVT